MPTELPADTTPVENAATDAAPTGPTFADLGLVDVLVDRLAALGYETPTPIQARTIFGMTEPPVPTNRIAAANAIPSATMSRSALVIRRASRRWLTISGTLLEAPQFVGLLLPKMINYRLKAVGCIWAGSEEQEFGKVLADQVRTRELFVARSVARRRNRMERSA